MAKDIRALTGVRGVAAGLVVLYHFGDVRLYNGGSLDYFSIPLGYLAVDLFFMLSGFVIALTYRDKLAVGDTRAFLDFMWKRVARLYPAYFIIGLFYVAKIAAGLSGNDTLAMFSSWDIVGNMLMLSGWGLYVQPLIGVAWAASAEMGSYLLAPLLIAVTLRRSPLVCTLVAVAGLLGICAVAMSGRGASGPLDVVNGNSFYPMLRAVSGFAIGMALFRFTSTVNRLSPLQQDVVLAVLLVAIAATMAWVQSDLLLYALLVPLVAVLSRDGRLAQALFGNAVVYRLGIISYSIYLIHPLFVSFAVKMWRALGESPQSYYLATGLCLVAILALSELSYRLVEMPGRNAIAGLLRRPERIAPGKSGAV